jgi:hypothetical protein
MDSIERIKILLGNCRAARANATAADDAWVGHVTGMEEGIVHFLGEIDKLERQRGALRAKMEGELANARKELDKVNLEIREARKTLEKTIKENDHQRAVGRAMFASIA